MFDVGWPMQCEPRSFVLVKLSCPMFGDRCPMWLEPPSFVLLPDVWWPMPDVGWSSIVCFIELSDVGCPMPDVAWTSISCFIKFKLSDVRCRMPDVVCTSIICYFRWKFWFSVWRLASYSLDEKLPHKILWTDLDQYIFFLLLYVDRWLLRQVIE